MQAALVLAKTPQAMQLRYLQALSGVASGGNSSTIVFPMPIDFKIGLKKQQPNNESGTFRTDYFCAILWRFRLLVHIMSIKSDKWIAKMAREYGMIEPFHGTQIRESENGGRAISYGVSSYGYDVRCANEF